MKYLFNKTFVIPGAVYLLIILLLQVINGWYQNFSDAVHYLWIADKYAEGDWNNAINTYWGPMISWLLLALKPFIDEPFIRFRLLQILLGFTALFIIQKILKKRNTSEKKTILYLCSFTPFIASYAWFYLTPDLLLLNGILLTLNFFDTRRELNFRNSVKAALLGALLFFIKSAGLYFFIILVGGRFLFTKELHTRKDFLQHVRLSILLLIFCSTWIIPISIKNNAFTMGTSSGHNYKMNSPRITPDIYGEVGNPYHLGQLTEPVPANAFDACVEHAHQFYYSWEGMSKKEIAIYYSKIIYKNLKSARSMYFGADIGTIFILLLIFSFILSRQQAIHFLIREKNYWLIFIANIILYLPFFFMDRYTWPGMISVFFLTTFLLESNAFHNKTILYYCVTGIILLLGIFNLFKEYNYSLPEKPITEQIWKTKRRIPLGRTIWICDKNDKRLGLIKGLIYYNHGQYLGALFTGENSSTTVKKELASHHIQTVLFLEKPNDDLFDTSLYKKIVSSPALSVYSQKKP